MGIPIIVPNRPDCSVPVIPWHGALISFKMAGAKACLSEACVCNNIKMEQDLIHRTAEILMTD